MPAGHTSRGPGSPVGRAATEEFVTDFTTAVMPYIEQHFRVFTDRANTAIAGLSMGGAQTLNIAVPRLERFAYIGVFSSGLIGAFPAPDAREPGAAPAAAAPPTSPPLTAAEWESNHAAKLDDAAVKKGLRLLWFATGRKIASCPRRKLRLVSSRNITSRRYSRNHRAATRGSTGATISWSLFPSCFAAETDHNQERASGESTSD